MYGNEASLGSGILASGIPRSSLFLTTKFHTLSPGQTVRQSLQSSLSKLQTDYVDLFLIHTPTGFKDENPGRLKELWRECEEVRREGLARSVGVSNFRREELEEVMEGGGLVPAVNQVDLSFVHPPRISSLLPGTHSQK